MLLNDVLNIISMFHHSATHPWASFHLLVKGSVRHLAIWTSFVACEYNIVIIPLTISITNMYIQGMSSITKREELMDFILVNIIVGHVKISTAMKDLFFKSDFGKCDDQNCLCSTMVIPIYSQYLLRSEAFAWSVEKPLAVCNAIEIALENIFIQYSRKYICWIL